MSNKLFIPEIGTQITLSKDWGFKLFAERRNDALLSFWRIAGDYSGNYRGKDLDEMVARGFSEIRGEYWSSCYAPVTLPAGTELTIDRIYIRRGTSDYSSLSFNLNRKSVDENFSEFCKKLKNEKGRCRFWAKLDDCNTIYFQ